MPEVNLKCGVVAVRAGGLCALKVPSFFRLWRGDRASEASKSDAMRSDQVGHHSTTAFFDSFV